LNKSLLIFITFILVVIFNGCGYKPTSYYAKHEISGKVYVKLKVDINNATNSVLAKDAVNEMVISQFGASLVDDESKADTIISVSFNSVSTTQLQSDNQDNAKLYRVTVSINLTYKNVKTNITKSLTVSDSYDYSVDIDSTVTDTKKLESIKIASNKALNDIFSQIAIKSFGK